MVAGIDLIKDDVRILIYSHDSFGLGHLRRCRAIAHALVGKFNSLSVLILSGSPIIGSFDFRTRVDFVRVPGVIKLRNGDYTSLSLHLDIDQTMELRGSIIQHTAEAFNPDIFIVDKEPLGLRGEVKDTLSILKQSGALLVLGLRDIMDEPELLIPEWKRKNVLPALEDLYDQIWVYGLPQFYDPLSGLDISDLIRRKMIYTGYLRHTAPSFPAVSSTTLPENPYILVTAGGGGDGENLVDWVLSAYELDTGISQDALIVLGPFMQNDLQESFLRRIDNLKNVEAITFDSHIEHLIQHASGVVAMGGYNTFCEILSFDKPGLVVPRTKPRLEQFIRACRAQELGLLSCLQGDSIREPRAMATALRQLTQQPKPSEVVLPGLLDGLENINKLVANRLAKQRTAPLELVSKITS